MSHTSSFESKSNELRIRVWQRSWMFRKKRTKSCCPSNLLLCHSSFQELQSWQERKGEGRGKKIRDESREDTEQTVGWKESRSLSIPFVSLLNSLPIFLSLQMLFHPRIFSFILFSNPFISFLFQEWMGANIEAQVFSCKEKKRQDCYFFFHPPFSLI